MHKAKHITSYYNLFPRINPSFSYCNRASPFFYYTLYINRLQTTPYISTFILLHKTYFPSLFHYLPVRLAPSFLRLYVAVVPPLEEASESWVCVRGRLSPLFVCSLFVLSSSYFFRYYTPSPWEKSPNRRVCDWGEDIIFVLLFPLLHSLSLGVDILSADSSLEV